MLRRTGTGTIGNPGMEVVDKVASVASEMLGWDDSRRAEETAQMMKVYELY